MCLMTTAWNGKAEGVTGWEMGEKAVSSKDVRKIDHPIKKFSLEYDNRIICFRKIDGSGVSHERQSKGIRVNASVKKTV